MKDKNTQSKPTLIQYLSMGFIFIISPIYFMVSCHSSYSNLTEAEKRENRKEFEKRLAEQQRKEYCQGRSGSFFCR